MFLIKSSLRYLLLILLLAGIVVTVIVTKNAWLPLLNSSAAGSHIERLPPDDRQAREAIIQGIQDFYAFYNQSRKVAWLKQVCQVMGTGSCSATL